MTARRLSLVADSAAPAAVLAVPAVPAVPARSATNAVKSATLHATAPLVDTEEAIAVVVASPEVMAEATAVAAKLAIPVAASVT